MTKNDAYAPAPTAVAAGGTLLLRPDNGNELVIHNIVHSTDARLEKTDGTTVITVDKITGSTPWMGLQLHCTYDVYYQVTNISATTNNIAPDGVVSK